MKYKLLGNTGVKVSELCFGTMSFGNPADEATSAAMFNRCREAGINFFDCANVYAAGKSEQILGKLVRGERDKVFVTSKMTGGLHDPAAGVGGFGYSRAQVVHHIDRSLQRLGTDYLDFYFLHRYDEHTALEDAMRAMDDLARAGKIRYAALSNFCLLYTSPSPRD